MKLLSLVSIRSACVMIFASNLSRSMTQPLSRIRRIGIPFLTLKRSHQQSESLLSRTAIHKMKKEELTQELRLRNMNSTGTRKELVPRLLNVLNKNPAGESQVIESQSSSSNVSESFPFDVSAELEVVQHSDGDVLIMLDNHTTYTLRTKGQSRINSSGTGVGIVLLDENNPETMLTARKYLPGDRSQTLAEYSAMLLGLKYAITLGVKHLVLETNHDVVANQLRGIFPVTKPSLKKLYWRVMEMKESKLDTFEVRLVNESSVAQDLAHTALATGKSLNMSIPVTDPMGANFSGLSRESNRATSSAGPIQSNDMEETVIHPEETYVLYFDGGVRGNPGGESGCGMVLYDSLGTEVWCGWKFMEPMTNNRAEYHSLLLGLFCARSLGVRKLHARGDSDLVVKQMNRVFRVKDDQLRVLWKQATDATKDFDEFRISFVPRAENKRADWLANNAMDTKSSYGFEEAQ